MQALFGGLALLLFIVGIPSPRGVGALPFIGAFLSLVYLSTRCPMALWQKIKSPLFGVTSICFYMAITSLWAMDAHYVMERTLKLYFLFFSGMALWVSANALEPPGIKTVFKILTAGLVLGFALVAVELATHHWIYNAFRGFEHKSYELWHYLVNRPIIVLVCFLFLVMGFWQKRPYAQAGLLILGAVVIFMSGSQSAQAGFIAGLSGYFLTLYLGKRFIGFVFIAAALLILTMPWMVQYIHSNAPNILTDFKQAHTAHRLEIWDFTARHGLERPIFGWGLEASRFMPNFGEISLIKPGNKIAGLHPHNAALQIWLEFGLIGVLAVIFGLRWLYQRIRSLTPEACPAIMGSVCCVGVIMLVSHGLWQTWWLASLIFTAIFAKLYSHHVRSFALSDSPLNDSRSDASSKSKSARASR